MEFGILLILRQDDSYLEYILFVLIMQFKLNYDLHKFVCFQMNRCIFYQVINKNWTLLNPYPNIITRNHFLSKFYYFLIQFLSNFLCHAASHFKIPKKHSNEEIIFTSNLPSLERETWRSTIIFATLYFQTGLVLFISFILLSFLCFDYLLTSPNPN